MNFVVTYTNGLKKEKVITLNTLQELIEFYNSCGEEIIIKNNFWYKIDIEKCVLSCHISEELAKQITKTELEIEIYNDYRE